VFAFTGGTKSEAQIKGKGKEYILDKQTDFKYQLWKYEEVDYVYITGINLPQGFKKPDKIVKGTNLFGYTIYEDVPNDTIAIKIPEKIEGYTVGFISGMAGTYGNEGSFITSVTFPNTIIFIGDYAFNGTSISSLKLPKNLKVLGEDAFANCKNLGGSIAIPESMTYIPGGAFKSTIITEVIIPDSITFIAHGNGWFEGAFYDCKELTSVKLPSHPLQYLWYNPEDGNYYLSKDYDRKDENHGAFGSCPRLSLATRKAIQDSGYKGSFD